MFRLSLLKSDAGPTRSPYVRSPQIPGIRSWEREHPKETFMVFCFSCSIRFPHFLFFPGKCYFTLLNYLYIFRYDFIYFLLLFIFTSRASQVQSYRHAVTSLCRRYILGSDLLVWINFIIPKYRTLFRVLQSPPLLSFSVIKLLEIAGR